MFLRKKRVMWTEELCALEAKKFNSRKEFRKATGGAANFAARGGFLEKICAHMERGCHERNYWTKERCLAVAAKFKTISELEREMPHVLNKIRKNKWNLDPAYKMERLGDRIYRQLYAFEFTDGYVYVGLSWNPSARYKEHLTSARSLVSKHIKVCSADFRVYPDFYHKNEVGEKEAELIIKYQKQGWKILNRAKAGGLGCGQPMWTKEKIKIELAKYENLVDFAKNCKGAYSIMYRNNWSDLIDEKYRSQVHRGHWTKEKCLEEARKYITRKEFRQNSSAAADYASRKGWLDEICSHMEYIQKPNGYWTKNRCIEELQGITTMEQLINNKSLYAILHKKGWMEELTAHVARSRRANGYWSKEVCTIEAKKFKTRNEFKHGSPVAYDIARKKKWLNDICTHMVSGRLAK